MKVLILTADSNGGYPVPAVKGGAVSTLIESLVRGNNEKQLCDMTIVSLYNNEAAKIARDKYPNIHFVWVKTPGYIKILDNILFWMIRTFFKKKKAISYKSVFSLLWYINSSSKYLKNNAFDKVVLENNIPIAKIIEKSGFKGQYYYHFHNVPRINGGRQTVFDKCTAYLCVSQFVGDEIEKDSNAIGPIPKDKIKILYNAIDTDLFKPFSEEKKIEVRRKIQVKYNIPTDNKIIIFTGRLSQEKGADKLLQAVRTINNVSVLIVGGLLSGLNLNDPYQEIIHQLASELGNKVIFTGYIDQKELPEYYNAADLAVLPSMWDEPAGLTMIEAMACGIPVITTNAGGIPEYVDGEAIIVSRDSDVVNQINRQITNVLSLSDDELKKISQGSRKRIVNDFSVDQYIDKFVSVL